MNKGKQHTIIDVGNYFIKYIGENEGSFSAKYTTDYQSYQDSFQRVQIDGFTTYLTIGEFSKEYDKTNKENFIPQLMYAICKANSGDVIKTNLCLMLPIMQMASKQKLIDTVSKNKSIKLKFNGVDKDISIEDTLILPEGYSSYFSLSKEQKAGDICIIDCGSRTINLCILENGKVVKLQTIKLGSYDFYTKIKNIENKDYTEEDIQRLIDNEIIKVESKEYALFLSNILNSIKPYANLNTYKVYWTGGTSLMLKEYIEKLHLKASSVLDNASTSNVDGASEACKKVWSNGDKQE
ncbi:ParM/StbA family protein [Clostridium tagluense]|uniref:ParM/StbA family protein n=1 Tax=Clostridium tagluense TaxID=360422 RepID=UPI001CF3DFC2|nr:ParM/StbA family protein [Clostridium tagluense]MCB2310614.1 ParM/StbA family protein [Clostridium tagluense]MCB2315655.1 ParM/StbA family protein [Clostridium tagluense]MCB2320509.1 ParM/StbA family protein [Clostridium tagluense]MCB2325208.1 ParM/StbA family protein [Clostridium tagluense]MCB2330060.1 ParM/StbA family protein [Clostridium tagluense]